MPTLKLAKTFEPKLCVSHQFRALRDGHPPQESCLDGECLTVTRERIVRESVSGIEGAATELYASMLACGYSDRATVLGSTTAMVLAIQGLAKTALEALAEITLAEDRLRREEGCHA